MPELKFEELAGTFKKSAKSIEKASEQLQEQMVAKWTSVQSKKAPVLKQKEQHHPDLAEEMLVFYPRKGIAGDYEDNTVDMGTFQHFNIRDLLARFFIEVHAHYGGVPNWRHNIVGITSMHFGHPNCPNAHLPMFDYDGKNVKKRIRKDVKLLQQQHGLGDAWVYETKRGFHVYFFCDAVPRDAYLDMLEEVKCCRGFKKAARSRGYSVLRVSAKYTDFDIKFLYVLAAKERRLQRMPRKAHTIRALLDLGQRCGTHFASLFPQWAHFQEDPQEWKPSPKRKKAARKGKRIRKLSADEEYIGLNNKVKMAWDTAVVNNITTSTTSTAAFTVTWTSLNNKTNY